LTILLDKLYDVVVYNYKFKRAVMKLLKSPLTVKNPAYLLLYNDFLENRMKLFGEVPFRVMIENTNYCNLSCTFCPHKIMKRKKGIMSESLFKQIIDQCKSLGINYVTIYGFGEPLLDPNFCEKVNWAKKKEISKVTTNTNALFLNEKISKNIIEAGLDEIYISIDAGTPETYRKVRSSIKLAIVEKNILSLLILRSRMGREKPIVILSYVESEVNKHETELFISKWKNLVDSISISKIHNWTGDIKIGDTINHEMRDPCRLLWTDMVINWDGKVPLCCNDYENRITLGNLKGNLIEKIWGGEELKNIRELHKKREFNKITPCRHCIYNCHDKSPWLVSK
jgi:radical SAM protein with 4Fe4S-binding SPASM domain